MDPNTTQPPIAQPLNYQAPPSVAKSSRAGVASIAFGLLAFFGLFLSLQSNRPAEAPSIAMIAAICLLVFVCPIVGFVVAVTSLRNNTSKKPFALAGLCLNGLVLLGLSVVIAAFFVWKS